MKKKIAFVIVAVLLILLVVFYFIPIDTTKEVAIKASLINTFTELSSPKEWQRWHPGMAVACKDTTLCKFSFDSAHNSFTIEMPGGSIEVANTSFMFTANEKTGLMSSEVCSYALLPTRHDDTTILVYNEEKNLLQTIFPFFDNKLNNYAVADSLKSFMETPAKLYGFPLKVVPVVDSNVVTTYKKCMVKERAETLAGMYSYLKNYIAAQHLIITQPYMAHYHFLPHDSMEIRAAISVNSTADSTKGISFMKMPAHGHVIVGYYKGSFGKRTLLYKAMQKYVSNAGYKVIASDYEKYLDDKVPETDSSQVEMEVYYPVLQ